MEQVGGRRERSFPETALIFPSPPWLVEERMIPSSPRPSVTPADRGAEESLLSPLTHPLIRSLAALVSPSTPPPRRVRPRLLISPNPLAD